MLRFVTVSCAVCFFLISGCQRVPCESLHETVSGVEPGSWLSAIPNPVPAGDPEKPVAITVVSWSTGSNVPGELRVKINREEEKVVGHGPSGSMEIDWIQFDASYQFRLYGKHAKLLAKLDLIRDD
jgi:hypothetical protein